MTDDFSGLDAALAAYVESEPSDTLREQIIAAAPRQRAIGRLRRWIAVAGLGLGLAASGAAGVAAGYTLGHPAAAGIAGPTELDTGQFGALADLSGAAVRG
jgi:hypothetical protein